MGLEPATLELEDLIINDLNANRPPVIRLMSVFTHLDQALIGLIRLYTG